MQYDTTEQLQYLLTDNSNMYSLYRSLDDKLERIETLLKKMNDKNETTMRKVNNENKDNKLTDEGKSKGPYFIGRSKKQGLGTLEIGNVSCHRRVTQSFETVDCLHYDIKYC